MSTKHKATPHTNRRAARQLAVLAKCDQSPPTPAPGPFHIPELEEHRSGIRIADERGKTVASVPRRSDDLSIAHLLAAAPMLLEAARLASQFLSMPWVEKFHYSAVDPTDPTDLKRALNVLSAAISAAEGKEPR